MKRAKRSFCFLNSTSMTCAMDNYFHLTTGFCLIWPLDIKDFKYSPFWTVWKLIFEVYFLTMRYHHWLMHDILFLNGRGTMSSCCKNTYRQTDGIIFTLDPCSYGTSLTRSTILQSTSKEFRDTPPPQCTGYKLLGYKLYRMYIIVQLGIYLSTLTVCLSVGTWFVLYN